VIVIDIGSGESAVRQFWESGKLIGECALPADPIPAPPKPDPWVNRKQDAVYKSGDRVVIKRTKSPYLTVGKTYAVEKVWQGTWSQYIQVENNRGKLASINGESVRPAKEYEQML
jgi:hypothetical protein